MQYYSLTDKQKRSHSDKTYDWIKTTNILLSSANPALSGSLFSQPQRNAFPQKYLSAKQTPRNLIQGGGVWSDGRGGGVKRSGQECTEKLGWKQRGSVGWYSGKCRIQRRIANVVAINRSGRTEVWDDYYPGERSTGKANLQHRCTNIDRLEQCSTVRKVQRTSTVDLFCQFVAEK